jgi:hypothetical protein
MREWKHEWKPIRDPAHGMQAGTPMPRYRCVRCGMDTGWLDCDRGVLRQMEEWDARAPCEERQPPGSVVE